MNRVLRNLLSEVGVEWPDGIARVVVLKNVGGIPADPRIPPDSARKGFKLLVLDRGGSPMGVATCGSDSDEMFARESTLLEALSRVPALQRIVPVSRTASANGLRMQFTGFVPGTPYSATLKGQTSTEWIRTASEILDSSEVVARAAEAFWESERTEVALGASASARLGRLAQAGFPATYVTVLQRQLDGIRQLPRALQHGDLWPGNAIRSDGSWWLIDFAEFGHVDVPMHDAWHMARYCPDFVGGSAASATASAALLYERAASVGLSHNELAATRLHYLIHMAWYRLRHGVHETFLEPFIRELMYAAEILIAGAPLNELVSVHHLTTVRGL